VKTGWKGNGSKEKPTGAAKHKIKNRDLPQNKKKKTRRPDRGGWPAKTEARGVRQKGKNRIQPYEEPGTCTKKKQRHKRKKKSKTPEQNKRRIKKRPRKSGEEGSKKGGGGVPLESLKKRDGLRRGDRAACWGFVRKTRDKGVSWGGEERKTNDTGQGGGEVQSSDLGHSTALAS